MQNLKNVTMVELDNSNGVLFICYDPDTQMVYLCGKVVISSLCTGVLHQTAHHSAVCCMLHYLLIPVITMCVNVPFLQSWYLQLPICAK